MYTYIERNIYRYKIIYKNIIYLTSRLYYTSGIKFAHDFILPKKVSLDGDKMWRSRTRKFKPDYSYVI